MGLVVCFAMFFIGLLSVGAGLFMAALGTLLFSPLLVALFVGPTLLIASLFSLREWLTDRFRAQKPEPLAWTERMD